eukprot:4823688-Prymnesium_polylepis.1
MRQPQLSLRLTASIACDAAPVRCAVADHIIAIGSRAGELRIWDLTSSSLDAAAPALLSVPAAIECVAAAAVGPGATLVAAGARDLLR